MISRRKLIASGIGVIAGGAGLTMAARQKGLIPPDHNGIFGVGETLTYGAQRLLTAGHSMAREFTRADISQVPHPNGDPPHTDEFRQLASRKFADWRLNIQGLVARPAAFSLDELKQMPVSTQITHLACEEGWSYIAEWSGVRLATILETAGVLPQAKYLVYFSLDASWWDSIDLREAMHPQTLLTYGMNGHDLPTGHGAPLRLRVPRQLGYKSVKHLSRIVVTDDLKGFGKGLGSSAPEAGFSWYAGI